MKLTQDDLIDFLVGCGVGVFVATCVSIATNSPAINTKSNHNLPVPKVIRVCK